MTEDNLMVMHSSGSITSVRSKRSSMQAPIDVSSFQDADYPSSSSSMHRVSTKAMRRNTVMSPLMTQQPILQPKPIKPLKGVSLNLQVQVADPEEDPESLENVKTSAKDKVKSQIRKSFGLSFGKDQGVACPCSADNAPETEMSTLSLPAWTSLSYSLMASFFHLFVLDFSFS